jgi:hypothetical protein
MTRASFNTRATRATRVTRATIIASGQRGSALLLALLVLGAISVVGIITVHKVIFELENGGNFRVAKQGYYVAEAGLAAPIVQAAKDQGTFFSLLQNNGFIIRSSDITPELYDFSTMGSFGPEFSDEGDAFFFTYFSDPVDTARIPGFSAAGFCYRRYTITADGFLGTQAVEVDKPMTLTHTAQARFISHVYMGPFPCGI